MVGYEMSKVKSEGQTCPSHLIMDVSSPGEPNMNGFYLF
jgi:hypothetical protein